MSNNINILHEYYMKHAFLTASISKCQFFKVGAVIVKGKRIISHGYNGTPENFPKECSNLFKGIPSERDKHHKFAELNTIHGEMNAILWAAKNGIPINGASLYVTLQPCHNCIKAIIGSGIKEIYYYDHYDKSDPYSEEYCKLANVKLECLDYLNISSEIRDANILDQVNEN